jgi:hypothetical protein
MASGDLQWKQEDQPDSAFQVLATAQQLTGLQGPQGPTGQTGSDGRELEITLNETRIETRYKGETEWTPLVDTTTFSGPRGESVSVVVTQDAIFWAAENSPNVLNFIVSLSALQCPPVDREVGTR